MSTRARIWNGPATAPPKAGQDWWKLTNLGGNAADLWIYDEIGAWGVTAQDMVSQLSSLNVAEITVHLNSPGGDVFDGIAIMNALRDHPANVVVKVDALAASIASVIAQAGNKVIMGRNSMMMIHNASGFAMGEAEDLRKMADLLEQTTTNIASIYAERAGGTAAEWLAVMADEKWYDAEDAVKAGLADEVAPLPTEREAHQQAAKFDLTVFAKAPEIKQLVGEHGPELIDRAALAARPPVLSPNPQAQPEVQSWVPPVDFAAAFRRSVDDATPKPVPFDPSLFRAAISLVTQDSPAPPPITTPEPPPAKGIDRLAFAQAIREAHS